MTAKLDRETAILFAVELLEQWFNEPTLRLFNHTERQEMILSLAKLYVKTARLRSFKEELSVEWARDERFDMVVQPHN